MIDRPRSVVITGVSQGIGRALMEQFAKQGWQVWGTIRNPSALSIASLDSESRARITLVPLEITDHAACLAIADVIRQPVDVLINSAASFGNLAFHAGDFSANQFIETLTINVVGPTVLARALKPRLLKGNNPMIIMMSTGNASISGNTTGHMLAYRASKSALNQVVRTLAAEWGPEGITTIALNPGWVRTRMGGEGASLSPEEAALNIISFINTANHSQNGNFVNTDRSQLPW